MKKIVLLVSLILMCWILACSKQDPNTLNIGIAITSAPYSFYNDQNKLVGFDIDISKEIAKRLNEDYKLELMEFKELIPKVASGHIDMGISSQYITDEREQIVDFSIPYGSGCTIIATRKNLNLFTLDELRKNNKKIGAKLGTTHARYLLSNKYTDIASFYPSQNDLNLAFFSHRIDAIMSDSRVLAYHKKHKLCELELAKECTLDLQVYGITFQKGNNILRKRVNKVIKEMIKDGTYEKISKHWMSVDPLKEYETMKKKQAYPPASSP